MYCYKNQMWMDTKGKIHKYFPCNCTKCIAKEALEKEKKNGNL